MSSSISVRDNSNSVRSMRFVQAALITVIVSISFVVSELSLNLDNAVFPVSALVSFVLFWSFYSWHLLGRRWFGPYGLFLLSASLFNGGQAVLEVFGLNSNGVLDGQFSPDLTVKALYLVALGLSALHFGAICAIGQGSNHGRFQMNPSDETRGQASGSVGWFCIALAAIPTALVLKDTLSIVASSGYAGLYGRSSDEILPGAIQALAAGLIPGIMFLAVGCQKRRYVLMILWGVVIAYSGTLILTGLRSSGSLLLISFTWLYHTRIRQLARTVLLVAGVGLLAVFAIVVVSRTSRSSWSESVENVRGSDDSVYEPLIATTAEMGGTLKTVAYTIDLFPDARPFDLGIGYAYALLTLMPNLAWDVHPALGHQYAPWLVSTVEPTIARHGGGLGYSFLAEPFANFGWYGVAPVLFLIGYFLVRMSDWAGLSNDPVKSAAVASFMAFFLFFPRSESGTQIRPLVYYSFLPYAAAGILAKTRSATRRALAISQARLIPSGGQTADLGAEMNRAAQQRLSAAFIEVAPIYPT